MAENELQRGHALVLSVRASRLLADAVEHLRCILLHAYILHTGQMQYRSK
jgi:hypothetical protein